MNLPFVSRREYDRVLNLYQLARLELNVARSELRHAEECRLNNIKRMVSTAKRIRALERDRDNWKAAYLDAGGVEAVGVE